MVDMGLIMKNSVRFNAAMETLKAEYEVKAEELKKDGERGNQLTEQMRQFLKQPADARNSRQQILTLRADYELKGKRYTEETRDQESRSCWG